MRLSATTVQRCLYNEKKITICVFFLTDNERKVHIYVGQKFKLIGSEIGSFFTDKLRCTSDRDSGCVLIWKKQGYYQSVIKEMKS